jgi:glucan phosphorylase
MVRFLVAKGITSISLFAAYKRPNLLLHDPDRLARILATAHRPVQVILAGKAHPRDEQGKAMIQEWVRFLRRPDVHSRAVFLIDYDILLAEQLVQGGRLGGDPCLPEGGRPGQDGPQRRDVRGV